MGPRSARTKTAGLSVRRAGPGRDGPGAEPQSEVRGDSKFATPLLHRKINYQGVTGNEEAAVNLAEGLRVECGHGLVIVHFATAIQNLQLAVCNGKADLGAILVEYRGGHFPDCSVEAATRRVGSDPVRHRPDPPFFLDMKASIPIVEAVELRLPLRLTLIASSHQPELKGSVQRGIAYTTAPSVSDCPNMVIDNNKQMGSNNFIFILRLQRYC